MSKLIVNKEGILAPIGTMEDFKRPSHNDFATSSELAARKFSGMRSNSITQRAEIWVEGEMLKDVSMEEFKADPMILNKALEDIFMLHDVLPDTEEVKDLVKKGLL